MSHYIVKIRFFGLHLTRRMYRCIFNHFFILGIGVLLAVLGGDVAPQAVGEVGNF